MLGPLAVALLASRRRLDLVLLAGAGVWLCREPASGPIEMPGVLLAVAVAAAITLPFGIADSGAALLQPWVVLAGLGVLSAVLPYSLEFAALRQLPAGVVGVLVCLEPAVAGLAGYVVLSEHLGPAAWAGIGCVVIAAASVAARATPRSTTTATPYAADGLRPCAR